MCLLLTPLPTTPRLSPTVMGSLLIALPSSAGERVNSLAVSARYLGTPPLAHVVARSKTTAWRGEG